MPQFLHISANIPLMRQYARSLVRDGSQPWNELEFARYIADVVGSQELKIYCMDTAIGRVPQTEYERAMQALICVDTNLPALIPHIQLPGAIGWHAAVRLVERAHVMGQTMLIDRGLQRMQDDWKDVDPAMQDVNFEITLASVILAYHRQGTWQRDRLAEAEMLIEEPLMQQRAVLDVNRLVLYAHYGGKAMA